MSTERKRAPTRANIFMASDVFFCHVLRVELSDLDESQNKPSLGTKGMILYQRHVHCYAEHGDLLEERFVVMMKNDGFHNLETVDKPKWTSGKLVRCADAQWWLGNDSQSSPASLKKLSSKSNNEHREKAGPDQSKHIYGT